jgi:hypothetical protein
MLRRVLLKTGLCVTAFSAGIVWGLAAEAYAAGVPFLDIFRG